MPDTAVVFLVTSAVAAVVGIGLWIGFPCNCGQGDEDDEWDEEVRFTTSYPKRER